MIADDTMATLLEKTVTDTCCSDVDSEGEAPALDYHTYLQTDEGEFDDIDEFDGECDNDLFESSQLHRLIQTQTVDLIDQSRVLQSYSGLQRVQPQEIFAATAETSAFANQQSAATSRSSSLFSTIFPPEEHQRNCSSSYDLFESIEEGLDDYDEPLMDYKNDALLYDGSTAGNLQLRINTFIPRTLPQREIDLRTCLELESVTGHNQFKDISKDSHYHYTIRTSSAGIRSRSHVVDQETLLVQTLSSKLSRYVGYYTADSKDQEYCDKVRYQEISYKFSKTY